MSFAFGVDEREVSGELCRNWSGLYRDVGRDEHCLGPSEANVPMTMTPPGRMLRAAVAA